MHIPYLARPWELCDGKMSSPAVRECGDLISTGIRTIKVCKFRLACHVHITRLSFAANTHKTKQRFWAKFCLFSAYFPPMVPLPPFFCPHVYGFCPFSAYVPLIFPIFSAHFHVSCLTGGTCIPSISSSDSLTCIKSESGRIATMRALASRDRARWMRKIWCVQSPFQSTAYFSRSYRTSLGATTKSWKLPPAVGQKLIVMRGDRNTGGSFVDNLSFKNF